VSGAAKRDSSHLDVLPSRLFLAVQGSIGLPADPVTRNAAGRLRSIMQPGLLGSAAVVVLFVEVSSSGHVQYPNPVGSWSAVVVFPSDTVASSVDEMAVCGHVLVPCNEDVTDSGDKVTFAVASSDNVVSSASPDNVVSSDIEAAALLDRCVVSAPSSDEVDSRGVEVTISNSVEVASCALPCEDEVAGSDGVSVEKSSSSGTVVAR
jgi:hypothetical protein